MNKIFIAFFSFLILISCNDSSTNAEAKKDTIPSRDTANKAADVNQTAVSQPFALTTPEKAEKMIKHFNENSNVNHSKRTEIQSITLSMDALRTLLAVYPDATRIRLLTAAYFQEEPRGRIHTKTVLIQFLNPAKSLQALNYVDIQDIDANALCPPPTGPCSIAALMQ